MRSVLTGLLFMVLGLGVVEMPLAEVEMRESIRDRASRIIRFLMGDKGARETSPDAWGSGLNDVNLWPCTSIGTGFSRPFINMSYAFLSQGMFAQR